MSAPAATNKIAVFVPSFRGGGAERAMILFAQGLVDLGFQVDFLVAQDEGPLRASLPPEVRLIDFGKKKVSQTLPALVRYLRAERPAALYSTIVNANITALVARLIAHTGCPVVIRESNVVRLKKAEATLARKMSGMIAPILYRLADSIISVSEDVASELSESSPSLRKKIRVLPNPVVSPGILGLADASFDHPWLRNGSAPPDEPPVVLGVGRLHPQKDFSTLLAAFAEVVRERPARLIILGEGAERPRLEREIEQLGLGNDVLLPGYVDNPFPYFKRARTFVLSSIYEGMPNALLQAMAFGTPVVATRCHSGAAEVLTDSRFGRLVPPGDVAAMAAAIYDCLEMPRSSASAEFVSEHFSVERATREYLSSAGLR